MTTLFTLLTTCLMMACSSDSKSDTPTVEPEVQKDVTIYVTSNDRSLDFARKSVAFSERESISPKIVNLDPSTKYQTMEGFGSAITGSTCFNLLKMNADDRKAFLKQTYSTTEGMGQSYIRIAIGCSDFSLSEYTLCDTEGLENFALQEEELNYIIPILKEILAINPNIKIIGSPWTAPLWMKVDNLTDLKPYDAWTSGQLNPKYYADYGTYFVKWVQAMQDNGIAIEAVTPQNEPLNKGNSASMYMTWQEQRDFVKNGLGPKLRAAGLDTKIYLYDHNYDYSSISDQNDYPVNIYNDSEASQYVAGAAFHNYGGNKSELLDIHNQDPNKELIFTETSIGTWNDGQNLTTRLMDDMEQVALGTINNWCKAVIVWNLMLDSERGPNREGGCQTCYGAVDIETSDYKTITKNSHYYIIGHLSSVVKPGAVRIGTSGYEVDGITYSAFENPDNTYAFVLCNNTSAKEKVVINDGTHNFTYEVPAKSVVSYLWNK